MIGREIGRPALAVVAVAVAAFAGLAILSLVVPVPRFFLDELFYMEAAVNLGEGDGLRFRDEAWGYGPLYPILLSGVVRATASQETTYELAKVMNALWFAVATVPLYLLARQVIRPWPSVAVVALSMLIPSTVYASVVMTESAAFLSSSVALLAIVAALRRPSVWFHILAVVAILVAALVRTQFVTLVPAYLGAIVLAAWVSPSLRHRLRAHPVALLPAMALLAAGVGRLVLAVGRGEEVGDVLGSYSVLARPYDPVDLAVSLARQVGDLALYLAVVPVVVAPAVLAGWRAGAKRGRDGEAALFATVISLTLVTLVVVAAFSSTEFSLGLLHDRNFFYLVPLGLIVLIAWVTGGMPRPPWLLGLGAAIALVGLASLPYDWLEREEWAAQFEATATELPGQVAQLLPDGTLPVAVLAAGVCACAAAVLAPRRAGWAIVGAVGVVLVLNSVIAWRSAFPEPRSEGVGGRGTRAWVDAHVPTGSDATLLFVVRPCEGLYERNAALQTLFFNRRAEESLGVGREGVALPIQATVLRDGRIVAIDGRTPTDLFVVAQPGVTLVGHRVATGTRANLVLWRIAPPLRAADATSDTELARCGPERPGTSSRSGSG